MKIIVERNCDKYKECLKYAKDLKKFLPDFLKQFGVTTVKYFIIANSDEDKFSETVKKYSKKITGDEENIERGEKILVGKCLSGIGIFGNLEQTIIIREFAMLPMYLKIARMLNVIQIDDNDFSQSSTLAFVLVFHEIGHAIDNDMRYRNSCYIKLKHKYDLSYEYWDYLQGMSICLWGEFYAEMFPYTIFHDLEFINEDKSLLIDCINNYLRYNKSEIVERTYRILYYYMFYLGPRFAKKIDVDIEKEFSDKIPDEYIFHLERILDVIKDMHEKYPGFDLNVDMNSMISEIDSLIITIGKENDE